MMSNTKEDRLVKDAEPDGLLYDPSLFCRAEQKIIVSALGWLTCLDVRRICDPRSNFGGWFTLNLGIWEEWILAKILIVLAAVEDGENMLEPGWTGARSTALSSSFHVPITWMDDLPTFGLFSCRYVSERNEFIELDARADLAEKYCGEYENLEEFRFDENKVRLKPNFLK